MQEYSNVGRSKVVVSVLGIVFCFHMLLHFLYFLGHRAAPNQNVIFSYSLRSELQNVLDILIWDTYGLKRVNLHTKTLKILIFQNGGSIIYQSTRASNKNYDNSYWTLILPLSHYIGHFSKLSKATKTSYILVRREQHAVARRVLPSYFSCLPFLFFLLCFFSLFVLFFIFSVLCFIFFVSLFFIFPFLSFFFSLSIFFSCLFFCFYTFSKIA